MSAARKSAAKSGGSENKVSIIGITPRFRHCSHMARTRRGVPSALSEESTTVIFKSNTPDVYPSPTVESFRVALKNSSVRIELSQSAPGPSGCWRVDLKRVIHERFGIDYHERYVGSLLQQARLSHVSARPRHPVQDEQIVSRLSKNFPRPLSAHLDGLPATTRAPMGQAWNAARRPLISATKALVGR